MQQDKSTPQGEAPLKLLRLKHVEQVLGLSRSTIYARLNHNSKNFDPDFPRPIKLSATSPSIAWIDAEVQAYIGHRIADSRKAA